MQCPFCKETIIDGATVCRFCGRDQPLSQKEKQKRNGARWLWLLVGGAVLVVVLLIWSRSDYNDEMNKVQAAAACNGTMTADQIRTSAAEAAKSSGMSEVEALHVAEKLACPSM
jgi:predicted nucleic acid-binding Zn ribbon protein